MSRLLPRPSFLNIRFLTAGTAAAAGLALTASFLAWVSSGFLYLQDWPAFLGISLLGALILYGGWLALRSEAPPGWLAALVIGAAALRLLVGVLWFTALPTLGHGSEPELAGYIMADAHERDQAAWQLAVSEKSLLKAFTGYSKADQYGGLLFLSALVYRYLGGASHHPLMMVMLTACASALAVLFTWALARRAWGARAAPVAAWGLALYPEAIYLGSSQMREAFAIPLTAAAFYGLLLLRQQPSWKVAAWILIPLALAMFFSPPFAALLLGALLISGLFIGDSRLTHNIKDRRRLWLLVAVLVVVVLAGLWITLSQFGPPGETNPVNVISWWIRKSADYQAHLTQRASGWVQKVLRITPDWLDLPFLTGYGVLRPFLPAALTDESRSLIWPWIELWRSIGWTLLLAFLLYAPLRLLTQKDASRFTKAAILIVWLVILIASFRAGGDQADNPRYRATFASLQVGLAAWVWVAQKRSPDTWLRRAVAAVAFIMVWTFLWYLRRENSALWPVADLFKTLALALACAFLFAIWDWARDERWRINP